jgi:hypothetical protein
MDMKKVTLFVTKITIMATDGTDIIILKFKGTSPYPDWMPDYTPECKIECAKDAAYSWLCANFLETDISDVTLVNCRGKTS